MSPAPSHGGRCTSHERLVFEHRARAQGVPELFTPITPVTGGRGRIFATDAGGAVGWHPSPRGVEHPLQAPGWVKQTAPGTFGLSVPASQTRFSRRLPGTWPIVVTEVDSLNSLEAQVTSSRGLWLLPPPVGLGPAARHRCRRAGPACRGGGPPIDSQKIRYEELQFCDDGQLGDRLVDELAGLDERDRYCGRSANSLEVRPKWLERSR